MKKLAILLIFVLMAPSAYADQALVEKAKAEGKAAFYANITAIEPIMEAFTNNYGVKGEYTRISTSKFLATVLTEYQAGKLLADVLQSPLPIMELLKEKGVLVSYKSPAAASYPEWTKKDNKIQIFGIE
jgi:iron(III) transport system substrate-binding protein